MLARVHVFAVAVVLTIKVNLFVNTHFVPSLSIGRAVFKVISGSSIGVEEFVVRFLLV